MASNKDFLDDVARVAGGAASLFSTVRQQIRSDLKERVGAYTSKMGDENSSEIDRLQATINKFRTEQEELKKRVAILEAALLGKAKTTPKAKPASKSKPVSKTKRK